jgi:hypothetical protein
MDETLAILTPAHPRWKDFLWRLAGPEGCDFREDDDGNYEWECDGTAERAKVILQDMGGFDVAGTLDWFASVGGGCDCEIFLNVDETALPVLPAQEEQ